MCFKLSPASRIPMLMLLGPVCTLVRENKSLFLCWPVSRHFQHWNLGCGGLFKFRCFFPWQAFFYSQHRYIDKCWTSFWSPIGSIWELTTNDTFLQWFCVPRLVGCFENVGKHYIFAKILAFVEKLTCLKETCRSPQTNKNRLRQGCSAVKRAWGFQNI